MFATALVLAAGLQAPVDPPPLPEPTITTVPSELRLGIERLKLPGDESLGLVGATYLMELEHGLAVGPAVYGAASGRRGGLFTIGIEGAARVSLGGPFTAEAGFYAGGGGGGGAPVGGGLMLRPHVGLLWDLGGWRAGVSLSQVRFPSGQISSNQFGLVFSTNSRFTSLATDRDADLAPGIERTGLGFDRFSVVLGAYAPRTGTISTLGTPLAAHIGTVGARAEQFVVPGLFVGLEAGAAATGGAAGYAEVLATAGVALPIGAEARAGGNGFSLGGRLALGMGGGGTLPVGGGLLMKGALDATWQFSRDLGVTLEGGLARAPQGTFQARFATLAVDWALDRPGLRGEGGSVVRQVWTAGIENYLSAARKDGTSRSLQNISFRVDRYLSDAFYLSGQAHSAYGGGAGGFSVGLVGAGYRVGGAGNAWLPPWHVGAELLAGAAGGGLVETGGGAIVQPMVFADVAISRSLALRGAVGRVHSARRTGLDSNVVELGLSYDFGVAKRR